MHIKNKLTDEREGHFVLFFCFVVLFLFRFGFALLLFCFVVGFLFYTFVFVLFLSLCFLYYCMIDVDLQFVNCRLYSLLYFFSFSCSGQKC